MMLMLVYNILSIILFPFLLLYFILFKRESTKHFFYALLPRSIGKYLGKEKNFTLWFHCASIGEVNTLTQLIKKVKLYHPDWKILLSVQTSTGYNAAKEKKLFDEVILAPIDFNFAVRRLLSQFDTKLLILMETEFWPNLVILAKRIKHVPIILINGRISDRTYKVYLKYKAFFRHVFSAVDYFIMKDELNVNRIKNFPFIPESKILSFGNLKYDIVLPTTNVNRQNLYKELKINFAESKVIVVGSLREGEEENIILVLKKLYSRYHNAKFILAPRHLHRIPYITSLLKKNNVKFALRTEIKNKEHNCCSASFECILLDTYGELIAIYSIAEIAIIGGSFLKVYGGHNPVEPASYGIPVVFGPYMNNFLDIAEELRLKGGALQVNSYEELYIALEKLIEDDEYRRKVGNNAAECILQHRGAAARTLSFIESLILTLESEHNIIKL